MCSRWICPFKLPRQHLALIFHISLTWKLIHPYLGHIAVEELVLPVHDHVVHLQLAEILQRLGVLSQQLALPLHVLLPLDVDRLGQLQAAACDFDIVVVAILERQTDDGESGQEQQSQWNAKRKPNQSIHNALAPISNVRHLLPDFPIGCLKIKEVTIFIIGLEFSFAAGARNTWRDARTSGWPRSQCPAPLMWPGHWSFCRRSADWCPRWASQSSAIEIATKQMRDDRARCAERSELTRRWSWPSPQLVADLGASTCLPTTTTLRQFPDAWDALRVVRAACACAGHGRSSRLPSSAGRSSAHFGGAARIQKRHRRESKKNRLRRAYGAGKGQRVH